MKANMFAKFIEALRQPEFIQINTVIGKLEQLYDICRFNYFSTLRTFNPDFSSDRDFSDYVINPLPLNTFEVVFGIILLIIVYLIPINKNNA